MAMILAVLLFAVGCNGGDSPTSPNSNEPIGPQYPNVIGEYFSQSLTFTRMTWLEEGLVWEIRCEGTLTIASQNAGAFGGSFITRTCLWHDDSIASTTSTSGTLSGQVRPDGGLNLTADTPGAPSIDSVLGAYGCFRTSASSQYNGEIRGGTLQASATATASCGFGVTFNIEQTLSGSR